MEFYLVPGMHVQSTLSWGDGCGYHGDGVGSGFRPVSVVDIKPWPFWYSFSNLYVYRPLTGRHLVLFRSRT